MKKIISLFFITLLTCGSILANENFTVVIDAGHGGKDGGAARGKIKEKDINLAVALNLGRLIEDSDKNVKVVYTRKSDVFVDLYKRTDIANKAKANLFISIHTNSTEAKTTTASGADTYILGLGRSEENKQVAQRENSVILLEDNYKQKYENFDPNSPESYIIFEFMTNKYMDQSLEFAGFVQKNFKSIAKRTDRGVRQSGFLVLRNTACPSVLIELGFINNDTEAKYLMSSIGQRAMASSVFSAFKQYKKDFDNKQGSSVISSSSSSSQRSEVAQNTEVRVDETPTPAKSDQTSSNTTFVSKPRKDIAAVVTSKPTEGRVKQPQPTEEEIVAAVKPAPVAKPAINSNEIEYRVQILMSNTQIATNASAFRGLSPIDFYMDRNAYKYTYGSTTNHDDAIRLQREARTKFQDAFIVKFRNGKRVQ